MPNARWYIAGYQEWACKEAYHIVLTTDDFCHLWLRWSKNHPQRHPRSRVFRGLNVIGDVYYCFTAYHDIEQEEAGYTLIHTFIMSPWLINPKRGIKKKYIDMNKKPYFEPWGATLTENHPWAENGFLFGSHTLLFGGRLTIFNDKQAGVNVSLDLADWPLFATGEQALSCAQLTTHIDIDPVAGWNAILVRLHKGAEVFNIEPVIARGSLWGPWGTLSHYDPGKDLYAFDWGEKPDPLNLQEAFQAGRKLAGLDPDPTCWTVFKIHLNNEQVGTAVEQMTVNDYMNFYYQPPAYIIPQTDPRWFYFHGQINAVNSPSTSPIFGRSLFYTSHNYLTQVSHENDVAISSFGSIISNPPTAPAQCYVGNTAGAMSLMGGAFRFRNLRIARCPEILEAFIWLNSWGDNSATPVHARLSAENIGHAADFHDITDPVFWARWAARTGIRDWDNITPWAAGNWYTSPSLIIPLENVLSRSDWNIGNALVLFFEDFDQRTPQGLLNLRVCRAYAPDPYDKPVLEVKYNHWQIKENL